MCQSSAIARGLSGGCGAAPHVGCVIPPLRGGPKVGIALCSVSNGDSEGLCLVTPRQGGGDKIDADLLTLTYIARGGRDANCGLLGVERA